MGGKATFSVMFARLPYLGWEHSAEVDFLLRCEQWAGQLKSQGVIREVHHYRDHAAPVDMVRNRIAKYAVDHDIDVIIMVDNDMGPDMVDPSKQFVPSSFEFLRARYEEGPSVIVAPACTAPPEERPVIGRWRTLAKGSQYALDLYTREEAAAKTGIQPEDVAGLGLCMIDCRVFTGFDVKTEEGWKRIALRPPWFHFEWDSEFHTNFITGEDTSFTRDVAAMGHRYGIPILYVNWDCWALHYKLTPVGKPGLVDYQTLRGLFGEDRELILKQENGRDHEGLVPSDAIKRLVDHVPVYGADDQH